MADTKVSALSAATTLDGTEELPVNQGGASKKATVTQIDTFINTSPVFSAGSATAGSWPKLTAGTVLTTPEVGALELDTTNLYGTTDAGNRGYIPIRHFIRADSTRTFTSNTSSQALFTTPAGGTLTLETGAYLIEGVLSFSAMSATSGNLLINLLGAGNATVAAWLWMSVGIDAATAAATTASMSMMVTSSSPASVVSAAVGTGLQLHIRGTFEVTGAGSLIPSITMVTASSTVLAIGSYLLFERMGSTTVVSVGQWT